MRRPTVTVDTVVDQSDSPRVFISYAQHSPDHTESVLRLYELLRACGIDAKLDLPAAGTRRDWTDWMGDQIRKADFVLVIASRAYQERAEGRGDPDVGRGVRWEARMIKDAFYRDQSRLDRYVPVVLPGQDIDGIPDFLGPTTCTVYHVPEFTVSGVDALLRFLTGQPEVIEPPLGRVPVLGLRPRAAPAPSRQADPMVHNVISGSVTGTVIQAGNVGGLSISGSGVAQAPAHEIGVGVSGGQLAFQGNHAAMRPHVALGEPTTDVEPCGPGVRQEFSGGWVLCALPDGPVLAVTQSIWEALHVVGGVAAVGIPVSDTPFVDDDALCVNLSGGTWGAGRLWRTDMTRDWEWQPDLGRQ